MAEERKENIDDKLAQEFEDKYKHLLDELKSMPRNTKEAKEQRFQWMKSRNEYSEFVADLMNVWKPDSYVKLRQRLERNGGALWQNAGMVTSKKAEEIDPVLFMEATVRSIQSYTGVTQEGKTYNFCQSVGQNYKQSKPEAIAKNDMDAFRTKPLSPERNWVYINKLVRDTIALYSYREGTESLDEVIDEIIDECVNKIKGHSFTKNDIEEAKMRCLKLDMMECFDRPLADKDGETLADTYSEKDKDVDKDFRESVSEQSFFESMLVDFEKKWTEVVVSTNKENRELIKAFLSKDLLIQLKLEYVSELVRKRFPEKLEPKCGQWCPCSNCPYQIQKDGTKAYTQRGSCYIRYGEREGCNENGDSEFYQLLKPAEDLFYEHILKNDYVKYAYCEKVEGIDDLYSRKLKGFKPSADDEDVFLFTDKVLGDALGYQKKKDTISKARKKYNTKTKAALYEIFKSK